jgi:DNA-3-methyladenine glycosylase
MACYAAVMQTRRLTREALPVETVALARFLIGKLVVRRDGDADMIGRIVETEAYPPGDAAMHAYRGITPRTRPLFLAHGHAYVYLCYGVSMMLNVSAEREGVGAGVLVRAAEPVEGVAMMMERRRTTRVLDLARGPGRLAEAMGIDKRFDGVDLCADDTLYLATDDSEPGEIGESTRIGITKDADRVLRYFVRGSRFVSGPGKLNRLVASMSDASVGGELQGRGGAQAGE